MRLSLSVDEKIPVFGAKIGWLELKSLGEVDRTQKFASPFHFLCNKTESLNIMQIILSIYLISILNKEIHISFFDSHPMITFFNLR